MIHINGEPNKNGIVITCKIEGPKGILAHKLEQLLTVLLKDDDLSKVLLSVLDNVQKNITNKGDKK